MSTQLRVGIVGCGRIASLYEEDPRLSQHFAFATHAKAYAHHPETAIVAAADPDPDRRQRFAATWDVGPVYESAEAMLDAQRLDVVSVCAATPAHDAVCLAAIERRVPAILCEKPLASDLPRAAHVVEAAAQAGVTLVVNYSRRFSRSYRELAQVIAGGSIGTLQAAQGLYSKGLRNHGSHLVNLLLWLAGPIVAIRAEPLKFPDTAAPDPTLNLWIEFERGFHGALLGTAYSQYKVFELDLVGTEGRLKIEDDRLSAFKPVEYEALEGVRALAPAPAPVQLEMGHAMYDAIDNVVRSLRHGEAPVMTGREALETELVLEAAVWSARDRRRVAIDEVRSSIAAAASGLEVTQ